MRKISFKKSCERAEEKRIPCMLINANMLIGTYDGELTISADGEYQRVELPGGEAPGRYFSRDSFGFKDINALVLFYVTKDENGNYCTPKGYGTLNNRCAEFEGDSVEYVYGPLSKPEENYFCGFCEYETGKVVIDPIYENATYFVHETVEVMKNGKWGTIDRTGRINLDFIYDCIPENHGQVCLVRKDQKYGLVGREGQDIIPIIYDQLVTGKYIFAGMIKVCKEGKWGIVNLKNEVVVDLVCEEIVTDQRCYFWTTEYHELATGTIKYGFVLAKKNGCWGAVDFWGNIWVDFKYERLLFYDLREGLLMASKEGLTGLIDWHDHPVIDFLYEEINNGQLPYEGVVVKKNGKWGMIDRKGQLRIDFIYDALNCGNQPWNRVIAQKDGQYGIVDYSGNILVNFIYENIRPCYESKPINSGFYLIQLNDKRGVMDSRFNICVPIEYDEIQDDFADQPMYKLIVRKNRKYGTINIIGNISTGVIYDEIRGEDFNRRNQDPNQYPTDLTIVEKDGLYGILDSLGRELFAPQFEKIDFSFHNDIIVVKKDNRYGFLDKFGSYVAEPVFEEAYCFNGDVAVVKKDGKYGYLDRCGNYLVKPELAYRARNLRDFLWQNKAGKE